MVTSELTDVEAASAIARARRERVIGRATADRLLARYAADTSDTGPLGVIALDRETLALARSYVLRTPLRTPDGIHLAACTSFAEAAAAEVRLLSRDDRQNDAARGLDIPLLDGP